MRCVTKRVFEDLCILSPLENAVNEIVRSGAVLRRFLHFGLEPWAKTEAMGGILSVSSGLIWLDCSEVYEIGSVASSMSDFRDTAPSS